MNDIVVKYSEYIKNKNLSQNTFDAYIRDLHNFLKFLQNREENLIRIIKARG